MHQSNYKIQDEMLDPIRFIAKYEADMMYYQQAKKKPFQKEFREAMVKEFNNHTMKKAVESINHQGGSHRNQDTRCHWVNETKERYPNWESDE